MITAFSKVHNGLDAISIFKHAEDYPEVFNVVANIQSLSYRIHMGGKGEHFITESFNALQCSDMNENNDISQIFAKRRSIFRELGLNKVLSHYKQGSMLRSLKIIGSNNFKGVVIDVGANDNSMGRLLLNTVNKVTRVIGIDIEERNVHLDSDRLMFRKQEKIDSLMFEDDTVDTILMRFSLHHMQFAVQDKIIAEAYRVLRLGGRIIIVEDTYSEDVNPLFINNINEQFMKLGCREHYLLALSFMDASSCFIFEEVMPFCFSFRSMNDWENKLVDTGFEKCTADYWGFIFSSLFQAPLGVIVYEKG